MIHPQSLFLLDLPSPQGCASRGKRIRESLKCSSLFLIFKRDYFGFGEKLAGCLGLASGGVGEEMWLCRLTGGAAISLVGSVYFKWRRVPRQRVCCISASWQTEPPRSGIEREGGGKKKTASGSAAPWRGGGALAAASLPTSISSLNPSLFAQTHSLLSL